MRTEFVLGDVTIHRLVEQETGFVPIHEFIPGLSPDLLEENRAWLAPAGLDASGKVVLCFQSYVIRTPHHTILVDSCIGNDKPRPTRPTWHMKTDRTYMDGLAALGLGLDDIDMVLCTHLHPDHVGWNTRLQDGRWVPTFPRARYLFSARELAHWQAKNAEAPLAHLVDSVLPIVAAGRSELIGSSDAIGDHLRLLPTPGHTPDHFSVLLGKGKGTDALLTGDAIHSPIQARYPELSMAADADPVLAAQSRRSMLERLCDTATLCCTAHFPSPSVGRIRRWGEGFRCDPV
ncbi:MAG: MBL fold metallo-hydrolase [Rhodospirillales bacterium]|nr:MBL fold metallo-hydrolase [Rhodospirillales bacterium]